MTPYIIRPIIPDCVRHARELLTLEALGYVASRVMDIYEEVDEPPQTPPPSLPPRLLREAEEETRRRYANALAERNGKARGGRNGAATRRQNSTQRRYIEDTSKILAEDKDEDKDEDKKTSLPIGEDEHPSRLAARRTETEAMKNGQGGDPPEITEEAFEDMKKVATGRGGDPVSLALYVCGLLRAKSRDNRNAFGASLKQLGKEAFVECVSYAFAQMMKVGDIVRPAYLQRILNGRANGLDWQECDRG